MYVNNKYSKWLSEESWESREESIIIPCLFRLSAIHIVKGITTVCILSRILMLLMPWCIVILILLSFLSLSLDKLFLVFLYLLNKLIKNLFNLFFSNDWLKVLWLFLLLFLLKFNPMFYLIDLFYRIISNVFKFTTYQVIDELD